MENDIAQLAEILKNSQEDKIQLEEDFKHLARLYDTACREIESYKKFKNQISSNSTYGIEAIESDRDRAIKLADERLHEINSLRKKVSIMENKLEKLESFSKENAEIITLQNEVSVLNLEVEKLDKLLISSEESIKRFDSDLKTKTLECNKLENILLAERDRYEENIYHISLREQRIAQETIQLKLNESRDLFDSIMDEMSRKQNHLEHILSQSEQALIEEREVNRQREEGLLDDIKKLQTGSINRWIDDCSSYRHLDLETEIRTLEEKIYELNLDNRHLQKIIDNQGSEFLREKYALINDMANLKREMETLQQNGLFNDSKFVKKLQEQKNVFYFNSKDLEFSLTEKEKKIKELEKKCDYIHNPIERDSVILDLENQKQVLENILADREDQLKKSERRINQIMNSIGKSFSYVEKDDGNRLVPFEKERDHLLSKIEELNYIIADLQEQFKAVQKSPKNINRPIEISQINSETLTIIEDLFSIFEFKVKSIHSLTIPQYNIC